MRRIKRSSTHPCSGPVINTVAEEECKRFSFNGFNPKVEAGRHQLILRVGYYEGEEESPLDEEKCREGERQRCGCVGNAEQVCIS